MQILENFQNLPSYKTLVELARHPIDLTDPAILTPERLKKFTATSTSFRFLFGMEKVSDEVVEALVHLAEEAKVISQMQKMQNGEVMNFIEGYQSENRAVLHTALRDFFDDKNTSKTASQASEMARVEVEKIKAFEKEFDNYTTLVMVGIGGSELGPEGAYLALKHQLKPGRNVLFIGNVDPVDIDETFRNLDLSKTLVCVISKSGNTQETVTNEGLIRLRYEAAGLDPSKYLIAATGEGSPMDNPKLYKACFYFWDWVGGRFSTTACSGGLLFTFAFGFNTYWDFLKGAHDMDRAALKEDITENIPLLGALIAVWNRNFLDYPTTAIIPYSKSLSRWAAHVQQVEMESNGKRVTRQGEDVEFSTSPIFWGEPGTNAQHSFFQMIHQGTEIVPIEFIGFYKTRSQNDQEQKGVTSHEILLSNLLAQSLSLAMGQKSDNPNKVFPGNRPSHILIAKELNAYTFGGLFAYLEHRVAFEGFIWNINSFDQEGVQLGKVMASRFVDLFRSKRAGSKNDATPLENAFIEQFDLLP